jgi:hypothetical protein
MTEMTALEAFRTSADADVYFATEGGDWVYLLGGCQAAGLVLLTVVDDNGRKSNLDLPLGQMISTRVTR